MILVGSVRDKLESKSIKNLRVYYSLSFRPDIMEGISIFLSSLMIDIKAWTNPIIS